ncbi:hypothetical protein LQ953_12065 [Sphingomonas sp. IC-56]|uniref:hypothetical protein n=1 Tax=Sphingomonas sp. IC-56 TaxID=2898529 RepID=UPI001E426EEE|nr:hypothetical protein [Sphingomonas sp. IC-56]MCD2324750.1 hypothetical protein [Sphingomonas sp. IC-56]
MAERKNGLGGVTAALALCAALSVAMPVAAQDTRIFSAASQEPPAERAGAPEDYAWIDRADALWDVIGDSPPDTAFTFADVEPWAWQLRDGHVVIVEEAAEGMRSYYFEPRSATPFLAVEPGASFAFEAGDLAMAYDADGTALSELEGTARLEQAMVLLDRAQRLKRAMRSGAGEPVDSGAWVESSLYMGGFLDLWQQGFLSQPAWRAQRESQAARTWRDRLNDERVRRRALGDGFRRWRDGGFLGRPPARWRRPDARPGQPPRQGVRPRPDRPATRPDRPRPSAGRPDRPRAPGAQVPALPPVITTPPPGAGRPEIGLPESGRPDRPRRPGWNGTRPGGVVGTLPAPPAAAAPSGVVRPPRPWSNRPGWNRPRPVPQPGVAPGESTLLSGVRPVRPMRPEGRPGWNRRPPIGTPAPATPSGVTPPVVRPSPTRPPADRPRAPQPAPAPAAQPDATPSVPQVRPAPVTPRPVQPRPFNVRIPNQD